MSKNKQHKSAHSRLLYNLHNLTTIDPFTQQEI